MTLFELIGNNSALFYSLVAITSLMVGSFLNVVIHRLPIMMERAWLEGIEEFTDQQAPASSDPSLTAKQPGTSSALAIDEQTGPKSQLDDSFNLAVPRSRCPACDADIKAWQNIPIISYALLKGKCANCKVSISARYPIIEFVTMLLSIIVAWQLGPTPQALLGIVVTWFLVAMSMIDIDHQLLPDTLTLPLMWIGLLAALIPVFADLRSAVIGAAVGYMILWSIYQLFKLITGKEGMGFGDFKLLAAIGALLGWQAVPMVILLSSLVGAVVGLAIILFTGRDKNIPIPFGPYLAAAGWLAMLWGDSLSAWYYGLMT
jgi:leader peptidase (prepilin peptidase)/N-methyltransferase